MLPPLLLLLQRAGPSSAAALEAADELLQPHFILFLVTFEVSYVGVAMARGERRRRDEASAQEQLGTRQVSVGPGLRAGG